MSIEKVAHELYGLAPQEFTSARNLRAKEAKAAGDPALAAGVQALRKPTTGAWLLNQLVRQNEEDVTQVLDLGARLRAAQGTLGADEVRDLDRQRRQLTRAVAQRAQALAADQGRRVSGPALAEVEETLRSAMVDAAAGAALRSGLLTDTFSSTGLEPVDLSKVVALEGGAAAGVPEAKPSKEGRLREDTARSAERERRRAEAEHTVAQAESALKEARDVAERARVQVAEARRQRERLETEREEARRRLHDLEAQVAAAVEAEDAASRDHAAADRARSSAVAAAEAAERLLDRLRGTEQDGGRIG